MDNNAQNAHLVEFYGLECPWCEKIQPLVERLEKEEGIKIRRLEVWHNEEHLQEMMNYQDDFYAACGELGVPSFINTKTRKVFCGEFDYDKLKNWAFSK